MNDIFFAACLRPFDLLFDGLITHGKSYDIGLRYEIFNWKNAELFRDLRKNMKVVSTDFSRTKNVEELVGRRGCILEGRSGEGRIIEQIITDFPERRLEIFRLAEDLDLINFLREFKEISGRDLEKIMDKSKLKKLNMMGVLKFDNGLYKLESCLQDLWKEGAWLTAYIYAILKKESEIDFDYCRFVKESHGTTHEADFLIGDKKNSLILVECKFKNKKELITSDLKKFFSMMDTLKPLQKALFFAYPSLDSNAWNYAMSKNIYAVDVRDQVEHIGAIISSLIKDLTSK